MSSSTETSTVFNFTVLLVGSNKNKLQWPAKKLAITFLSRQNPNV
jgi:hypothetical protein